MRRVSCLVLVIAGFGFDGCSRTSTSEADLKACEEMVAQGFLRIAESRDHRFQGKVQQATALCRGGARAAQFMKTPWLDWTNYWATADAASKAARSVGPLGPDGRGIDGALLDLEYERIELIKFNLFDNSGAYEQYVKGRDGVGGPALKTWKEMRLPPGHANYRDVGGDGNQVCQSELIRSRTLTGICNDIRNPLMGSTGQPFARNVEFDTTFPELGRTALTKNRHGDRLSLLKPDPQVISRKLFTRRQPSPDRCAEGYGLPGFSKDADCDYKKAPFFNVLAAFWIQFMTHDWFSHLEEGHNAPEYMSVGCTADDAKLGCRPGDQIDRAYIAEGGEPGKFTQNGKEYLKRAPKTYRNTVTAWWDASQLYGYDDRSRRRVKRDPKDRARLLLTPQGYLPLFEPADPINPEWAGQEAAAFPDNWTIGMSFYHNVFAREHNAFVDEFRKQAVRTSDADSGLRNPARPGHVIRYKDVTADELFEVARLVLAAEIAKIHTTEWTTQLLYDEPLYKGMNANWSGLLSGDRGVADALEQIVVKNFGKSEDVKKATQWYSVFATGPGIVGLGNTETDVNAGVNHFGSPFNFPEEFITVYRLHPLVPDLIEYREWDKDPNQIRNKIPVVETFQSKATTTMQSTGLANWALSMGSAWGCSRCRTIPAFCRT